jgi:O-antigen ligase
LIKKLKGYIPAAPTLVQWGVCIYLVLLALPLDPKLPLIFMAILIFFTFTATSFHINSVPREVLIALGLFLGSTLISCLLSASLTVSILACLSFIPAICLFIIISTVFTADGLGLISTTISITALLIAGIFCAVAFYNPGLSPSGWIEIAGYPHIGVTNDLGILSIMAAAPTISLFFRSHATLKYLAVITLVSILACLVIYRSRGSMLTLMLTSIITVALLRPREILPTLAIILTIIFSIDVLTGFSFTSKLMEFGKLTARLPQWISALHMFIDAPWFGLGPGFFSQTYQEYFSELNLPSWIYIDDRHMPWPHNLYLELLAERGITGFATFLFFIAALYRTLHTAARDGMKGHEKRFLQTAAFALTALLISGIYESSLLRYWVLIMYFLFTGIICAATKPPPPPEKQPLFKVELSHILNAGDLHEEITLFRQPDYDPYSAD